MTEPSTPPSPPGPPADPSQEAPIEAAVTPPATPATTPQTPAPTGTPTAPPAYPQQPPAAPQYPQPQAVVQPQPGQPSGAPAQPSVSRPFLAPQPYQSQPTQAYPAQQAFPAPQPFPGHPQPAQFGQPVQPAQFGQGVPAYQPGQAAVPAPGAPVSGAPTSAYPAQYPATAPQGYPAPGYGQPGLVYPPPAPRKSRAGLIIGIVLGVALLLCGGGGVGIFLYFSNNVDPLGSGAESPKAAADAFLEAFYTEHDPVLAEKAVCKQARDKKVIEAQIQKIEDYGKTYRSPKFTWDEPTVSGESAETAEVSVKLTMSTSDEKVSSQSLKLTVVKKDGWRVCEVS